MKRTRRLTLLLLAGFALLGFWLVATNSGLRFLVARALPGDGSLRVNELRGSLWSGVEAHGLRVETPGLRIVVSKAHADLAFAPLWRGALRLRRLDVDGLRLDLPQVEAGSSSTDRAPTLPDLRIEVLHIENFDLSRATEQWHFQSIDARVATRGSTVAVDGLHATSPQGRIDGDLMLDLRRDLPVHSARLAIDWRAEVEHYVFALEARTRRGRTELTAALRSPLLGVVALSDVRDIARWQARIEVPKQTVDARELSASLAVNAQDGALRVQGEGRFGDLQASALDLAAQIEDDELLIAPSAIDFALPEGRIEVAGRVPFSADQALDLRLQSAGLDFRLSDASLLNAAGTVQVGGRRDLLSVSPDLLLRRAGWPEAHARGRITQNAEGWLADGLAWQAGNSRLQLDGPLLREGEAAPLHLQLRQFDPAILLPDWPGQIDADLDWIGTIGDQGFDGVLQIERLQGELRDRVLAGQGEIRLDAGLLDQAALSLSSGTSSLRVTRNDATTPLELVLSSPDLDDLWPGWQGRAELKASFDRLWQVDARLDALTTPQFSIAQAEVQARAGEQADAPVSMQATLRQVEIEGGRFERLGLTVDGQRAAHRIDLDVQSGLRQIQLVAEGGLSPQRVWRGQLKTLDVVTPEWRGALTEASNLSVHDARITLARSCLRESAGGRICLQFDHADARTEVATEIVAVDLEPVAKLWAPSAPFATSARLSGSVDLLLVDARLRGLNARLESAEGTLKVEDRPDLDLGWRDFVLDMNLDPNAGRWTASAGLRPEGEVRSQGTLEFVDGDWQYQGSLSLKVHRFDVIEAFTSQFASPRGDMSGDMSFQGRGMARPQWSGSFAVTGFAAELPELGLTLNEGSLAIVAVPTGMIVRGAITSEGGQLVLDGRRGAEARAPWQFALNGTKAVLVDTPALRLVVSPVLTLDRRESGWLLGGQVQIDEARIDAEALAPQSAVSGDVVVVDAKAEGGDEVLRWAADVTLDFGDKAKLIGYGFDGRVQGELRVRQHSDGNAYGQGQLQVGGRYAAYGQRLTIRRGRLLFANSPLDEPTLDIEAERKAGSAVAGVRVTGTARAPQSEIYARPALPESEALALLVTGRNVRGVSGADRQRLSNAALALGTIGGDLLASNLGAEIGITGDAARGTEAFTIGKYLTPKLFVGYGIGLARNGSVLIIRYLIRDDVELEATSGEQSRASLNYIIEK